MKRYLTKKDGIKIQLAIASILWGLLVAIISAQVVSPLPDWLRVPAFLGVFYFGFRTLEISVKKSGLDEEESSSD